MAGKIVHLLSATAIIVTTVLGTWFFIGLRYKEFGIINIMSNILT